MDENDLYDITIIGGGPVGLFAAFYAGMRQMKTKIIDSLPELGGQLSTLYPEKFVYDMPGFPEILARDLAEEMIQQGTRFGASIALGERVESITGLDDGAFELRTNRSSHFSRTVLISAGAGAFAPKTVNVPGVKEFEGGGVHFFVRDKSQFAGKRLLIVGAGDSALDWAMNLEPLAESITLIHRRDIFRAHEESVDWLFNRSRVQCRLFTELRRLEGNGCLQRVVVFDNRTDEEATLDVDHCLINIGFQADIGPIKNWGLEMRGNAIVVDAHCETSIPGIYAAGDICAYEGKIKLIATGVGEACTAVCYAKVRLNPKATPFPGHSSNMDLGR